MHLLGDLWFGPPNTSLIASPVPSQTYVCNYCQCKNICNHYQFSDTLTNLMKIVTENLCLWRGCGSDVISLWISILESRKGCKFLKQQVREERGESRAVSLSCFFSPLLYQNFYQILLSISNNLTPHRPV